MKKTVVVVTEEVPFESLLATLQELVERLDRPDLSLDDSLALYEQAVRIAAQCQHMLDGAELRIREIRTESIG